MRLRHFRLLLLTFALVIGQWLTLAHAFEHPALAGDDSCQICVQHGLEGTALAPQVAAPQLPGVTEAPVVSVVERPAFHLARIHRIRGPPQTA